MNKTLNTYIKNKEEYLFQLSGDNSIITENKPLISSSDGTILIYINGVIYNKNEKDLISGFKKEGAAYVTQLIGSFVIFLVLGTRFFVLTDITNSKKAYYCKHNSSVLISNNINLIKSDIINIDGVASYLYNGTLMNGITVFENTYYFQRASVNIIDHGELSTDLYDTVLYQSNDQDSIDTLRKELQEILEESVALAYNASDRIGVSLSAGWDARGILGFLAEKIKAQNVACFTFTIEDKPRRSTDGYLSKKLAEMYGYTHNFLKTYDGNIIKLIKDNAEYGRGVTNIFFEMNTMKILSSDYAYTDYFVGDEIFGWRDMQLKNEKDVLHAIALTDPSGPLMAKGLYSRRLL